MGKITWNDRTNTGADSIISASIFNDIKNSVNAIYEDDVPISGSILISGSIIPDVADGQLTSSFDLGSETAAWRDIYVSDGSIKFIKSGEDTTSFTKEEVSKLQAGKSISKVAGKQLVNENDNTTYVRMSSAGRAVHYAGGNAAIDIKSDKVTLGGLAGASTGLPVSVPGPLTLPGGISGSFDVTGSGNFTGMTVQEVLDALAGANIGGDTSITGSTDISGSLVITGSSVLSGSIDLEGVTTTYDLLNAIAGFEVTGSVDITGSTTFTGSIWILPPPPPPVVEFPLVNTLFYGYSFTDASTVGAMFADGTSNAPNSLSTWRFSTSSQDTFNGQTPTDRTSYFLQLAQSASDGYLPTIDFYPNVNPNWRYRFRINANNAIVNNGPNFTMGVNFIASSSTDSAQPIADAVIPASGGGANGKFVITVPPNVQPSSGFALGDLLDLLSAFGNAGVPSGSLGDLNFSGAVNISDLLLLLAGFGNPNNICNSVTYNANTNYQLVGPIISVCDGTYMTIQNDAYVSIT